MSTYDYIVHQREKAEEEAREREIEEMEAQKSKTAKVCDELPVPVTLGFIVGVKVGTSVVSCVICRRTSEGKTSVSMGCKNMLYWLPMSNRPQHYIVSISI